MRNLHVIGGLALLAGIGGGVGYSLLGEKEGSETSGASPTAHLEDRLRAAEQSIPDVSSQIDPSRLRAVKLGVSMSDYRDTVRRLVTEAMAAHDAASAAMAGTVLPDAETAVTRLEQRATAVAEYVCDGGVIDGPHVICLTTRASHPAEVRAEDVPVAQRKRVVLRCAADGSYDVREESIRDPLGDGIVLVPESVMHVSIPGIETEYDRALRRLCCADCAPTGCWVGAGDHHGACPGCLCRGDCAGYCQ